MKSMSNSQNTKVVRYVPEHMMGCHKFRTKKRVVSAVVSPVSARKKRLQLEKAN